MQPSYLYAYVGARPAICDQRSLILDPLSPDPLILDPLRYLSLPLKLRVPHSLLCILNMNFNDRQTCNDPRFRFLPHPTLLHAAPRNRIRQELRWCPSRTFCAFCFLAKCPLIPGVNEPERRQPPTRMPAIRSVSCRVLGGLQMALNSALKPRL